MTTTQFHNIKMILLTAIPIALGVIGVFQQSMTVPAWVVSIAALLTLVEHLINGNTPANVQTTSQTTNPATAPQNPVQ